MHAKAVCAVILLIIKIILNFGEKYNGEEKKILGMPGRSASRLWPCKLCDLKIKVTFNLIFKKVMAGKPASCTRRIACSEQTN